MADTKCNGCHILGLFRPSKKLQAKSHAKTLTEKIEEIENEDRSGKKVYKNLKKYINNKQDDDLVT